MPYCGPRRRNACPHVWATVLEKGRGGRGTLGALSRCALQSRGELEKEWTFFCAEHIHRSQYFVQVLAATHQESVMCNRTRGFDCEEKTFWCTVAPVFKDGFLGNTIKTCVNLDGGKMVRVFCNEIARLHARFIKFSRPTFCPPT